MSPRQATHFLLLRQKKVSKEKATPLRVSRSEATGNLRCSVRAEGIELQRAMARTWAVGCWMFGRPSEAKARAAPPPLWLRRGAQCSRPHACRRTGMLRGLTCRSCLSRVNEVNVASSAAGRMREHRRLPRSEAQGTQTVGSPFFGYFLWRSKESDSPAGANSRLRPSIKRIARIKQ